MLSDFPTFMQVILSRLKAVFRPFFMNMLQCQKPRITIKYLMTMTRRWRTKLFQLSRPKSIRTSRLATKFFLQSLLCAIQSDLQSSARAPKRLLCLTRVRLHPSHQLHPLWSTRIRTSAILSRRFRKHRSHRPRMLEWSQLLLHRALPMPRMRTPPPPQPRLRCPPPEIVSPLRRQRGLLPRMRILWSRPTQPRWRRRGTRRRRYRPRARPRGRSCSLLLP
mmetsp:Transcript_35807/g.93952  ORF Transcript_35807/g.93952 Transcript_35807/m.93952 type:complete len:221 (-) Transcript_35807:902-1564(-)